MRVPALLPLIGATLVSAIAAGWTQPPRPAAAARPPFAPPVRSPEVHADGTVTFRLRDPAAQAVLLAREGAAPVPMQKDTDGVWSVTTGSLEPDLYGYSFLVDGVSTVDPVDPLIKPGEYGIQSMVHVPGTPPAPWDRQQVMHGVVDHHFYHSAIIGDETDYYVYTPPGYDPHGRRRYPVLYLLHGFSDDASGWTAVGQANFILDDLIAAGHAKPMLVVMPLGYGAPEILSGGFGGLRNADLLKKNNDNFIASLLQEVIPQVEQSYVVQKNRDARAIAGLSMGGAESLSAGLNYPDTFGYVVGLSSALVMLNPDFNQAFPVVSSGHALQPRLLWIACGKDDFLLKVNQQFENWLTSKDVHFSAIETPGGHTWFVWRRNLVAFAPLLFSTRTASR